MTGPVVIARPFSSEFCLNTAKKNCQLVSSLEAYKFYLTAGMQAGQAFNIVDGGQSSMV